MRVFNEKGVRSAKGLTRNGDEKPLTASIINNYVRLKIMPPPVKKKYGRVHLAYLIMLCTLKQSLNIAYIQKMLPADYSEESTRQVYSDFVGQFRGVTDLFVRDLRSAEQNMFKHSVGNSATAAAIISNLAKDLTEYLLQSTTDTPTKL